MKNLMNEVMDKLNKELERRGIVYEAADDYRDYGAFEVLEGVYDWGFTTIMYCDVVDPIISFYDWEYQKILSLDCDEYTTYRVTSGYLSVKINHAFAGCKEEFSLRVREGAPVHVEDIEAIGYNPQKLYADDERFYALKNGWVYFQKSGEDMIRYDGDVTIDDFVAKGYELVEPESYQPNVDSLNEIISRHIHLRYRR